MLSTGVQRPAVVSFAFGMMSRLGVIRLYGPATGVKHFHDHMRQFLVQDHRSR
jgi:hypothetical protein